MNPLVEAHGAAVERPRLSAAVSTSNFLKTMNSHLSTARFFCDKMTTFLRTRSRLWTLAAAAICSAGLSEMSAPLSLAADVASFAPPSNENIVGFNTDLGDSVQFGMPGAIWFKVAVSERSRLLRAGFFAKEVNEPFVIGVYSDVSGPAARLAQGAPSTVASVGKTESVMSPNVILEPGNYWVMLGTTTNLHLSFGNGALVQTFNFFDGPVSTPPANAPVFPPQLSPGPFSVYLVVESAVNHPPSALTFTNTTTSILETTSTASNVKVADIVVTDDAFGTNNLTLSGADAESFEIVDTQLFLKAGTVLNAFAKGSFTVTVSADDPTVGATPDASAEFSLTIIHVNVPPVLHLPDSPVFSVSASRDGVAVFFDVYATDLEDGEIGATATPPSGSVFPVGDTTVYVSATDEGGLTTTGSFVVHVEGPSTNTEFESGGQVPREPEGVTFKTFGIPAINDDGELAFTGTITDGETDTPMIFARCGVFVRKGDPAVDSFGLELSGRKFVSFTDPAINAVGAVAFIATSNTGEVALYTDLDRFDERPTLAANNGANFQFEGSTYGTLRRVVRINDPAVGLGRVPPRFTRIISFTLGNDAIFFTAYIRANSLWSWTPDAGMRLLLKDGTRLPDGREITQIFALQPDPIAPGHGRSTQDDEAVIRVRCRDGSQSIIAVNAFGAIRTVETSDARGPIAALDWPIMNYFHEFSYKGILKDPRAFKPQRNKDEALFVNFGFGPIQIIQESDSFGRPRLPGVKTAAATVPVLESRVGSLSGPLFNNLGTLAFRTVTTGPGAGDSILQGTGKRNAFNVVARIGGPAADVPGAVWSAFKSVALPDDLGVLLDGMMQIGPGGVTAANAHGLWLADEFGSKVQLLLREGDAFGEKTIRTMTVLSRVLTSPDQTRSFNGYGQIAVRVVYTDDSQGIITINIPTLFPF